MLSRGFKHTTVCQSRLARSRWQLLVRDISITSPLRHVKTWRPFANVFRKESANHLSHTIDGLTHLIANRINDWWSFSFSNVHTSEKLIGVHGHNRKQFYFGALYFIVFIICISILYSIPQNYSGQISNVPTVFHYDESKSIATLVDHLPFSSWGFRSTFSVNRKDSTSDSLLSVLPDFQPTLKSSLFISILWRNSRRTSVAKTTSLCRRQRYKTSDSSDNPRTHAVGLFFLTHHQLHLHQPSFAATLRVISCHCSFFIQQRSLRNIKFALE